LADKIVVMNKGEIVQVGEPLTVYGRPTTKFIAGFIGSPKMNFIPCRLLETSTGGLAAELPDGTHFNIPDDRVDAYRPHLNRPVEIGLRPQHLTVGGPKLANTQYLESTVDVVEPTGSETLISFTIKGHVMTAFGNPNVTTNPGQRIRLQAHMDHMHLIDPQNEQIVAV
ncbi:MAG: TOBE domain-containing protein, partial [Nitrospiraceae bacterium]